MYILELFARERLAWCCLIHQKRKSGSCPNVSWSFCIPLNNPNPCPCPRQNPNPNPCPRSSKKNKGEKMKDQKPIVAVSKSQPGVIYLGRIPHGFYEEEMKSY